MRRLDASTVQAVRLLIAGGLSHSEVARAVGVGRTTVQTIIWGRGPYGPEDDESPIAHVARPWRCSGCGRLIYAEHCLACEVQRLPSMVVAPEAADRVFAAIGGDVDPVLADRIFAATEARRAELERRAARENCI